MKKILKNNKPILVEENIKSYFWDIFEDNSWEPETFVILDRFLNKDSTYIDIGAWIGPTVLYGAHTAKKTIALEPDKVAFEYLKINVALNKALSKKISLMNKAVSINDKPVMIHTGSEADSSSSLINPRGYQDNYLVEGTTIKTLLKDVNLATVDLIKIDVEGYEYYLVPKILNSLNKLGIKPAFYLSIHPPFIEKIMVDKYKKYPENISKTLVRQHVNLLTNRLIRSFKNYKYIYDSNGKLIKNRQDISLIKDFDSFVATDKKW